MNGILQGTTPSLVITIPQDVPVSNIIGIELTFQHKDEKTIKTLSDVSVDSEHNTLTYNFTELETLAMDPKFSLVWQLRVKTSSGIVGTLASAVNVFDLISEAVMG